ncbi:MAG: hypothetical protein HC904_08860 [Blastochloris sp.]|nr:hypothetical protein [Blastochloris sp.]
MLDQHPQTSRVAELEQADWVVAESLTGYPPGVVRAGQGSILLRRRKESADRLEQAPVVAEPHP